MVENLTNDELHQIFTLKPENKKIKQIIEENNLERSLLNLREHAFGEYWKRKLVRNLNDNDIDNIIKYFELSTSKGVIGDASRLGFLSMAQCKRLISLLNEDDWAFKQIKARIILETLRDEANQENQDNVIEKKEKNKLDEVEHLIKLKTTWAIVKTIPFLNKNELQLLKDRMESKDILNRGNRHIITESISKTQEMR